MAADILLPAGQKPLIWINPERMGGAPCFYGTQLPVSRLFEYLEGGVCLEEWLEAFPAVSREQAIGVLEFAQEAMLAPVA